MASASDYDEFEEEARRLAAQSGRPAVAALSTARAVAQILQEDSDDDADAFLLEAQQLRQNARPAPAAAASVRPTPRAASGSEHAATHFSVKNSGVAEQREAGGAGQPAQHIRQPGNGDSGQGQAGGAGKPVQHLHHAGKGDSGQGQAGGTGQPAQHIRQAAQGYSAQDKSVSVQGGAVPAGQVQDRAYSVRNEAVLVQGAAVSAGQPSRHLRQAEPTAQPGQPSRRAKAEGAATVSGKDRPALAGAEPAGPSAASRTPQAPVRASLSGGNASGVHQAQTVKAAVPSSVTTATASSRPQAAPSPGRSGSSTARPAATTAQSSQSTKTGIAAKAQTAQGKPQLTGLAAEAAALRAKHGKVVRVQIMTLIGQTLASPATRTEAGLPSAMGVCPSRMAVGTSRGLVLVFDVQQTLLMTLGGVGSGINYGAVTCVAVSRDGTRLMAGFDHGHVVRWDLETGKVLNTIADAHRSPVLTVAFTDDRKVAITHDANGQVFAHAFKRVVGVRMADSNCIYASKNREEMATTVQVLDADDAAFQEGDPVLLAVGSIRQISILVLRNGQARRISGMAAPSGGHALPTLDWNMLSAPPGADADRVPVLCYAWGRRMRLLQVFAPSRNNDDYTVQPFGEHWDAISPIRCVRWLTESAILVIDSKEHGRILDVSGAPTVIDMTDFSHMQLTFNTRFAQQHGGETLRDYSNGISCLNGLAYMLSLKGINLLRVLTWKDRVSQLVTESHYVEAIRLGMAFHDGRALVPFKLPKEPTARRQAARDHLLDVIETYADVSVVSKPPSANSDHAAALRTYFDKVAATCIESAVAVQCHDVLFGPIFDKFSPHPQARAAFLEGLRPLIMSDKLRSLSPAVMQALFEHYKSIERPDIVEECVLHLDVVNMDLHQMVVMCWTYGLYDAMIYVYNQGMNDYLTPLLELFQLLREAIRAHSAELMAGDLALKMTTKEQEIGYKLLLYISFCLSGRAFPRGDIPPERARLVKGEVYKHILQRKGDRSDVEYPHIRALLQFDTREFLNVLALAFDETDDAFSSSAAGPALPSRQVVVDTLLYVMVKDRRTLQFSPEQACHLFTFIARQLARHENSLSVDSKLFDEVLERLTMPGDLSRGEEREQAMLALLDAGGLQRFEPKRLLALAERAGFYAVMEVVLESLGRFADIIPCYLKDKARQIQVFSFIHRTLQQHRTSSVECQRVRAATIDNLATLVQISPKELAKLVLTDFADHINSLVATLRVTEDHVYAFLDALVAVLDDDPDTYNLHLPDAVQEEYIELMCKRNPTRVYKYLEAHDNYRVAQCLELCKRYKLTDATAWLLEKKGDFLEAFSLIKETVMLRLSNFNQAFLQVDADAVAGKPLPAAKSDIRAVKLEQFRSILNYAREMLLRTSQKVEDAEERKRLWCPLLESLLESQRVMREKLKKTAAEYKLVMQTCLSDLVRDMTQYVAPPVILHIIMSNKGAADKFGEIKPLVMGMLDTYTYETTLLTTATDIVYNDVYEMVRERYSSLRRAYSASWRCSVCKQPIYGLNATPEDLVLFRSGICTSLKCLQSLPRRRRTMAPPPRQRSGPGEQSQSLLSSRDVRRVNEDAKDRQDTAVENVELAIDQRLETLKSSIASLNYMQLLNELEEAAVEAENDPHGAAAKRQRALMADPKFELRLAPPRKQAEARTRRRTAAATAAEAAAAANGAPPRMRERIGSQGI